MSGDPIKEVALPSCTNSNSSESHMIYTSNIESQHTKIQQKIIPEKSHNDSNEEMPGNVSLEPVRKKTNNLGFRPGLTQTNMYNHRRRPEA